MDMTRRVFDARALQLNKLQISSMPITLVRHGVSYRSGLLKDLLF